MANSEAFAPPSVPCVMPVKGTLPVFVSVKACSGSVNVQARPGQLRVWLGLHVAGVNVAPVFAATPVPLSATGEPVIVTLPVIVAVPVMAPVVVG